MNNFMPLEDIDNTIVNLKNFNLCRKEGENTPIEINNRSITYYALTHSLTLTFDDTTLRDKMYIKQIRYIDALYSGNFEFKDKANTIIFNYIDVDYIQKPNNINSPILILGYKGMDIQLTYNTMDECTKDLLSFIDDLKNIIE